MHNIKYLLFPIIFAACSSREIDTSHSFRIYKEGDVTVAESIGEPRYSSPLFDYKIAVILEQDENREETLLYRTNDFLVSEDGLFYMFDQGNNRIAVFDSNGRYQRSIGRAGEGPGEFQGPRPMWLRNDTLAVFDIQQRRASLFRTDGTFISSFSQPFRGSLTTGIYFLSGGGMFLVSQEGERMDYDDYFYWNKGIVLSAKGDTLLEIESPRTLQGRWFRSENISSQARVHFGASTRLAYHPERGILCYCSDKPELRWYSLDGHLEHLIRLGFERELVTNEERSAIFQDLDESIETTRNDITRLLLRGLMQHSIFPEFKSFWTSTIVDDFGFYWLSRHYDPTTEESHPSYRILSPEGEYLGDTSWPSYGVRISRGYLLAPVQNEETGEIEYLVYTIVPAVEGLKYP